MSNFTGQDNSNYRHGDSRTRLYHIYELMKQRCNPKYKNIARYKNYAGRGIKVCDEWVGAKSFPVFKEWALSHGYNEELTLERIDVDGDYSPQNCKWIPKSEQVLNTRVSRKLNGISLSTIAKENNLPIKILRQRLDYGWDMERILKTPIRKRKTKSEMQNNQEGE